MRNYRQFSPATTFTMTVGTTAMTLTGLQASYVDAVLFNISVQTAPIRLAFKLTPTTTVGHRIDQGEEVDLEGFEEALNVNFIRDGSTDAILYITPERPG